MRTKGQVEFKWVNMAANMELDEKVDASVVEAVLTKYLENKRSRFSRTCTTYGIKFCSKRSVSEAVGGRVTMCGWSQVGSRKCLGYWL